MRRKFFNLISFTVLIVLTFLSLPVEVVKSQINVEKIAIKNNRGEEVLIYEESHALIIWTGNYQQHWSKLNNVESEAKEIISSFEKRGFKVRKVAHPNGEILRKSIKDFIDDYGYQPNNRLVIFFAGHGHTRMQSKGYLVPIDAPDPRTSKENNKKFLSLALPMQQIITWAKIAEAKHILFVFDSCFAGTIFKQRSSLESPKYVSDVMEKPVRQFLTAGDAGETVPAKSVFTPLFIRALDGDADFNKDNYVTGNELGLYLRQNLNDYDRQQTPQFGTIRDPDLDEGDIVFRSLAAPIDPPPPSPPLPPPPPKEPLPLIPPQKLTVAEAIASNYYSDGYNAMKLVDNKESTYWSSKSRAVLNNSIEFYFEQPQNIGFIRIFAPIKSSSYTVPRKIQLRFFDDSNAPLDTQDIELRYPFTKWQPKMSLNVVRNVKRIQLLPIGLIDDSVSYLTLHEVEFYTP